MPSGAARAPWTSHDLEPAGACPICGSSERTVLYQGVRDSVGDGGGEWTFHACSECGCLLLDPRPRADALARAYENYHTHKSPAPRTGLANLRRQVGLWILARRFRTRPREGHRLARWFAMGVGWLPTVRRRALGPGGPILPPRISGGRPPRFLDVGCGSGWLLETMQDAGWEAEGQEWDEAAANAALRRGLHVTTGPVSAVKGSFELITMLHVVEHVADPVDFLREAATKLSPHGRLVVTTPNVEGEGHRRFGRSWRGLEAPRHLQIFNGASLRKVAEAAGLVVERVQDVCRPGIWRESRAIAKENGVRLDGVPRNPPRRGVGDELVLHARR